MEKEMDILWVFGAMAQAFFTLFCFFQVHKGGIIDHG